MESAVRQRLLEMTADFYSFHAQSFDQSRRGDWNSWPSLFQQAQELTDIERILDIGCGNGRFAAFLDEHGAFDIDYLGYDTDEKLLDYARKRHPKREFVRGTVEHAWNTSNDNDLIVCFGLFHHLPGADYRARILAQLHDALKPGGIAVISFWQPKRLDNFEHKIASQPTVMGLEANDYLMGWNGDFSHLRYCHHFDDDEIESLVSDSPFELAGAQQGSGNDASNRYVILR